MPVCINPNTFTVCVCLVQEISRLAGQLRRLYGSNKKATRPFHLFLTDLREDSRLYKECLRMNDGFLNYMVIIAVQILNSLVNISERKGKISSVVLFSLVKYFYISKQKYFKCYFIACFMNF